MSDTVMWNTIVTKQYVRILAADNPHDRQMEIYLFALALRGVLRGESLARRIADSAGVPRAVDILRLARAAFNGSVPHAINVRDIIEHFDDYRLGEGRLQKGWLFTDYMEWVEHDETGSHVLVVAGHYRLPIDLTKAATDYLSREVVKALRITSQSA